MKGRLPLGKRCGGGYTRGISGGTSNKRGSHHHTRPTRVYSPPSWHNCPSLRTNRPGSQAIFQPVVHSYRRRNEARLAGIRTRIQGSAQCPRNQPQGGVQLFWFPSLHTQNSRAFFVPQLLCSQTSQNTLIFTHNLIGLFYIYTYPSILSYIEVCIS